jgi:hypothetical protein
MLAGAKVVEISELSGLKDESKPRSVASVGYVASMSTATMRAG